MFKKIIAALFIFTVMEIAISGVLGNEEAKADRLSGLEIGLKAPDFKLKNLAGELVKLSDYEGKQVILNFWATWCPPCKIEMPDIQKFYTEYGDKVQILSINIDPEYDVAGFAKQMGVNFPILLDEDDKVSDLYQILTIPTTYFIDENGIIQNKHLSVMSVEQMRKYTKMN